MSFKERCEMALAEKNHNRMEDVIPHLFGLMRTEGWKPVEGFEHKHRLSFGQTNFPDAYAEVTLTYPDERKFVYTFHEKDKSNLMVKKTERIIRIPGVPVDFAAAQYLLRGFHSVVCKDLGISVEI